MRYLIITVLLLVHLHADEIERIESIVNDIKNLRVEYDKSQEDLTLSLVKLKDEQDKNKILLNNLKNAENEIKILKKQIKSLKSNDLSNSTNKIKTKEKTKKYSDNQILKENEFPELQMRIEKKYSTLQREAQTYRLNKNALIYSAIEGEELEKWEKGTSFTSNYRIGSWIKVTGYFVKRAWKKSKQDLWVKVEDAKQR